jgi:hypothetical protein
MYHSSALPTWRSTIRTENSVRLSRQSSTWSGRFPTSSSKLEREQDIKRRQSSIWSRVTGDRSIENSAQASPGLKGPVPTISSATWIETSMASRPEPWPCRSSQSLCSRTAPGKERRTSARLPPRTQQPGSASMCPIQWLPRPSICAGYLIAVPNGHLPAGVLFLSFLTECPSVV